MVGWRFPRNGPLYKGHISQYYRNISVVWMRTFCDTMMLNVRTKSLKLWFTYVFTHYNMESFQDRAVLGMRFEI